MHLSDQNIEYLSRKHRQEAEYAQAWETASPEFKKQAEKLGLKPHIENQTGMSMEFDENYAEGAYTPDMAELLDTHIDELAEKYGGANTRLIRSIADDLKRPMDAEIARQRASLLARVAGYLIKSETKNVLARIHQLAHAIPGFAKQNGFHSLRQSAKECGVSVEWLRRGRDSWCELLGIPVPADGTKSDEAKKKYRKNALSNHWRRKVFNG